MEHTSRNGVRFASRLCRHLSSGGARIGLSRRKSSEAEIPDTVVAGAQSSYLAGVLDPDASVMPALVPPYVAVLEEVVSLFANRVF